MHDNHLFKLRFTDNILLLATSKDNAICMLEILTLKLADIGFILNIKKTKVLTIQMHDFDYIVLHDIFYIDAIDDFECH